MLCERVRYFAELVFYLKRNSIALISTRRALRRYKVAGCNRGYFFIVRIILQLFSTALVGVFTNKRILVQAFNFAETF